MNDQTFHAPANVDELLAAEAKAIATNLSTGANSISTQGGRFKFPDDSRRDGPLSMVVLGAVFTNQLWNGNEMNNAPKIDLDYEHGILCQAVSDESLDRKSMAPSPLGVHIPGTLCQTCPQNLWDNTSKPPRRIGQCKNILTLAVMYPDPDFDSTVYLLRTSPTGATEAAKVIAQMRKVYGHPLRGQVVLDFVPTSKGADRLRVSMGQANPHYARHFAYREDAQRVLLQDPKWADAVTKGSSAPATHQPPPAASRANRSAAAAPT